MNECSSVIFGVRLPNPHVSHVYHFCSWISVCRPIKCRKVLSSKLQEKAISRQVLVPYVQLDNYKQYTAHPSAYHHHHHDHISIFMHTHNSRIHDDPFTHWHKNHEIKHVLSSEPMNNAQICNLIVFFWRWTCPEKKAQNHKYLQSHGDSEPFSVTSCTMHNENTRLNRSCRDIL